MREAFADEIGSYKYWDVVASSALVRSRSFGAVAGMEEAGILDYEILAMGDERTCPICEEMNGKVFSVAVARDLINKVLDIDDPEAFKQALPWQKEAPEEWSIKELENAGMSLPPFHGRCRCTIIMNESVEHDAQENTVMADFDRIEGKHTWSDDLAAVNPNYSTEKPEWTKNCQRCVIAYEARRRGYDVEALPRVLNGADPLVNAHNGSLSVFKMSNIKVLSCEGKNGDDIAKDVRKSMRTMGIGVRAFVMMMRNNVSGHIFIAEQSEHDTFFLDPQNNRIATSHFGKFGSEFGAKLVRVDNLAFTDRIKLACKNRRISNDVGRSKTNS